MQTRLRGAARDWYDDLEDYSATWGTWKEWLTKAIPRRGGRGSKCRGQVVPIEIAPRRKEIAIDVKCVAKRHIIAPLRQPF
ncbi:unnamed protein product [Arctia plantaginis]|uniref:Uncharacterized protein n=1 Tax=Arctia plantaginis TaxID=874455 RepID=A0A8S0Z237_ARCPL|nr:unnamed protein product [Arctia plantaginis]